MSLNIVLISVMIIVIIGFALATLMVIFTSGPDVMSILIIPLFIIFLSWLVYGAIHQQFHDLPRLKHQQSELQQQQRHAIHAMEQNAHHPVQYRQANTQLQTVQIKLRKINYQIHSITD